MAPRLQYNTLDEYKMSNNKSLKEYTGVTDKFMILVDLSYPLSMAKNMGRVSSEWSDKEMSHGTRIRLAYQLINLAGHYKHYVSSRMKRRSTIILYCSDPNHYDEFKHTLSIVSKTVNLLKKVVFIEKIADEVGKYTYLHLAYFSISRIIEINRKSNTKVRVMYIGNNMMMTQLLNLDSTMIHIKNKYIKDGLDVFFDSEILSLNTDIIDMRDPILIPAVLGVLGFRHGFKSLSSKKRRKKVDVYTTIYNNTKDNVDYREPEYMLGGLGLSDKDIDLFKLRVGLINPLFHSGLYATLMKMFKVWESKIYTKRIHNHTDEFIIDGVRLHLEWVVI